MTHELSTENPYGPFATNADLPVSVKNRLPAHAQEVFRGAYNRCLEEFGDVEHARRMAWGSVSRLFREKSDGTWVARTGDPDIDQPPAEFFQPRRRRAV